MNPLFLMGVGLLMLLFGWKEKVRVSRIIAKRIPGKNQIPQVLHAAIIATQLYELVLVIKHASLVTVSAALLLLAIMLANKSGTDDHVTDFHRSDKTR